MIHSGFKPIILDNLSNTDIRNINGINKITRKNIKFYNIDCTNSNQVKSFLKKKRYFRFNTFAAFKSVEESVRLPEKYFKNNIGSLEVILEEMKKVILTILFFHHPVQFMVPRINYQLLKVHHSKLQNLHMVKLSRFVKN